MPQNTRLGHHVRVRGRSTKKIRNASLSSSSSSSSRPLCLIVVVASSLFLSWSSQSDALIYFPLDLESSLFRQTQPHIAFRLSDPTAISSVNDSFLNYEQVSILLYSFVSFFKTLLPLPPPPTPPHPSHPSTPLLCDPETSTFPPTPPHFSSQ